MADEVFPPRTVSFRRILQARQLAQQQRQVAGDRPQPRPAAREPQLTIGLLQHRRAAGKAQPLWRRRHPLPDAGEGGHGSPLHGGVLNDDPATMRDPPVLQRGPGKTGVLAAVGRLVLHHQPRARNLPVVMSNIGQNMRFRTPHHRQHTVTGILAHRLVEIVRRMSHAAADQQRDFPFRRQPAGGVDGRDHGVAGQHHHVHLRQRG